jgi:acetyl-CoA synthase
MRSTPPAPTSPSKRASAWTRSGQFEGVNEFVKKASRGAIESYNFYSMVNDPMTTCGCCECHRGHAAGLQRRHDRHRDYTGETPCGMKFTTLAGVMGGGASSPGFVGHSKFNITQK